MFHKMKNLKYLPTYYYSVMLLDISKITSNVQVSQDKKKFLKAVYNYNNCFICKWSQGNKAKF